MTWSGLAKEENVVEWSGAIFVMKFWSVIELQKQGNMDRTKDMSDSVNSILDGTLRIIKPWNKHLDFDFMLMCYQKAIKNYEICQKILGNEMLISLWLKNNMPLRTLKKDWRTFGLTIESVICSIIKWFKNDHMKSNENFYTYKLGK